MTANHISDNGFWDIEDLSYYLKVKVKTLYAMVSDIPHYRVGKLIRFKKNEIDSWMQNKKEKTFDEINKTKNIIRNQSYKSNMPIDKMTYCLINKCYRGRN